MTGDAPLHGFLVTGSHNMLVGNSTMAIIDGVIVPGHHDLVLRNQVSGSLAISVSGEDNWLIRNTAVESDFSGPGRLVDEHGDCAHNRWIGNVAASADPACILDGPLAVSQAQ